MNMPTLKLENISPGKTFPERFKYLRALNHVTRRQVSKDLGVSISLMDRFTQGERTPTAKMQAQLADYFGVSTDYLMGRSDSKEMLQYTDFIEQYSLEESTFLIQYRAASVRTRELVKGIIDGAIKAQKK